ncbi:MAG: hypothetical protein OXH47_00095 [Paracoccaceae bacterium]|nr:hypothetical protein [Paracoccaceae bacterium]
MKLKYSKTTAILALGFAIAANIAMASDLQKKGKTPSLKANTPLGQLQVVKVTLPEFEDPEEGSSLELLNEIKSQMDEWDFEDKDKRLPIKVIPHEDHAGNYSQEGFLKVYIEFRKMLD